LCVCVCVRSEEHTSELQSHLNLVCRLLLESEEHTSELQSHLNLVCRLLLEKKKCVSECGCVFVGGVLCVCVCVVECASGCGVAYVCLCVLYRVCVYGGSNRMFIFLNNTATTEISAFSLPDALPI